MPIYEFFCETCGVFQRQRSLKEAGEPMICPTCQTLAKRIYSPPGFILTPGPLRHRMEQSAEPKVVQHSPSEVATPSAKPQYASCGRPWQIGC
jgi:putative FmdB family regulatory protein